MLILVLIILIGIVMQVHSYCIFKKELDNILKFKTLLEELMSELNEATVYQPKQYWELRPILYELKELSPVYFKYLEKDIILNSLLSGGENISVFPKQFLNLIEKIETNSFQIKNSLSKKTNREFWKIFNPLYWFANIFNYFIGFCFDTLGLNKQGKFFKIISLITTVSTTLILIIQNYQKILELLKKL